MVWYCWLSTKPIVIKLHMLAFHLCFTLKEAYFVYAPYIWNGGTGSGERMPFSPYSWSIYGPGSLPKGRQAGVGILYEQRGFNNPSLRHSSNTKPTLTRASMQKYIIIP